MTGAPQPDLPGGAEATAAEYVLGLLTDEERRDFEVLLAQDADLQQDVASWCAYFAALTDPIPETPPPATVWTRLEARLNPPAPSGLWRQVLPYLLGAVVAAGIAWAAMVAGLLVPGGTGPELHAELVAEAQGLTVRADYAPARGTLLLRREGGDYPPDRALEVWLLSDAAQAPVSLGVIAPEGESSVAIDPALAAQLAGATIALSEEPPGGSPTGAPTGPVIALARLDPR
ncbi:anti-sigma factor [Salipiger sp. H15]|uniref:Regulator of SigK n=1 Tax=Alloyangia sp. H15 TaxID=3029062 RepID=A0AAU8AE78_9RHOB